MARIKLTPKVEKPRIALDDDPALPTAVGQTPDVTLVRREMVGRNQAGDRLLSWVDLGTVPAVSYEQRTVVDGEQNRLLVKVIVVWEGDPIDPNDLGFRVDSYHGIESVFKVMHHHENGLRLELEGERFL